VDGDVARGHVAKHQVGKRAADVHANGLHSSLRFDPCSPSDTVLWMHSP
jgi:hypothetical protein